LEVPARGTARSGKVTSAIRMKLKIRCITCRAFYQIVWLP
jgi:hypothetical protein